MPTTTCTHCGGTIPARPKGALGPAPRYCTADCRVRANRPPRAVAAAAERARVDARRAAAPPVTVLLVRLCERPWCGVSYLTGDRARPSRYCPPCRNDMRAWITCGHCGRQGWVTGYRPRYCSVSCAVRDRRRGDHGPRRLREYAAPGLTQRARSDLLALWRRQGRTCAYCPRRADTVDHVVPLLRGGTNYEGNLTPCCRRCNGSKRDALLIEWRTGRRRPATPAMLAVLAANRERLQQRGRVRAAERAAGVAASRAATAASRVAEAERRAEERARPRPPRPPRRLALTCERCGCGFEGRKATTRTCSSRSCSKRTSRITCAHCGQLDWVRPGRTECHGRRCRPIVVEVEPIAVVIAAPLLVVPELAPLCSLPDPAGRGWSPSATGHRL